MCVISLADEESGYGRKRIREMKEGGKEEREGGRE